MRKNSLQIIVAAMTLATMCAPASAAPEYSEPCATAMESALPVTGVAESTDGVNNYKTFRVNAEYAAEYHIGFWLLPAEFPDGSHSVYTVYVNGSRMGVITPTAGNWQYATTDDNLSVFLAEGDNAITVATAAPEIPAVESIRVASNPEDAVISSEAYDEFLADAIAGEDIATEAMCAESPDPASATYIKPDFLWDMELRYSFYKKVEFTKGQGIFIASSSEKPHIIDVMFCGEYKDQLTVPYPPVFPPVFPGNSSGVIIVPGKIFVQASSAEMQGINYRAISEKLTGSDVQVATLKIPSLPKTGVYLVRLRTTENSVQGTASVHIDNKYFYENCPVSCSKKEVSMPADGVVYASMTQSDNPGTDNPMIFIHGNEADRVVGWNDNGPQARLRENNLDKWEAYISQAYLVKTSAVSVSSAYSSRPVSKCDVITRMAVGNGQSAQAIAKAPSGNCAASVALPMDNPDNVAIPGYVRLGEVLTVKSDVAIKSITAYDISGKILSRVNPDGGVVSLPLSGLNILGRGIYILAVTTEKSTVSGKILVK